MDRLSGVYVGTESSALTSFSSPKNPISFLPTTLKTGPCKET